MLIRRGYDAGLSFGAFDHDALISFTLNGIGLWIDRPTAYDTGTGTLPGYRGRGLSKKVFEYALPHLKNAGITQYLLEVLQNNSPAIKIYSDLGFRVTRELNYYVADALELNPKEEKLPPGLTFISIGNDFEDTIMEMNDLQPSWQNSMDALNRDNSAFIKLGVFDNTTLVGVGFIEPSSGDVPFLVVKEAYRRSKIGSALLSELLKHNQYPTFKIVNIESTYIPTTSFLAYFGLGVTGKQYEMLLDLDHKLK